MQVVQVFMHNSLSNFNYIVYSTKSKSGVVFDPFDLNLLLGELPAEVEIKYHLQTHHHPDHIRDIINLSSKLPTCQSLVLADGDSLVISGRERILSLSTPGHVADHKCYLLETDGILKGIICGDTLFNAGVGNCRLGGDVEDLFRTVSNLLMNLPGDLAIYPSHDFTHKNLLFALEVEPDNRDAKAYLERYEREGYFLTSIAEEKKINPFFRYNEQSIQRRLNTSNAHDTFVELRRLRDHW